MANAIATTEQPQVPAPVDPLDAEANTALEPPVITFSSLKEQPIVRQMIVMLAIAASVAIGVAVVLWSQEPTYRMLSSELAQKDALQVLELLTNANIDHKIDETTGRISVIGSQYPQAKLLLAQEGLPPQIGFGDELLDAPPQFGETRFAQNARHRRALEGELARTIALMTHVQSARVHLAFPKQSAFIRKRKKPSAAVIVKLYAGRVLEKNNIQAIVNLVSTAVPNLEASHVTITDTRGNLLKGTGEDDALSVSSKQMEMKRKIENDYAHSIEAILSSFLGPEGVRAEVKADIDFSVTENTREIYEPDNPAKRSEQTSEERSSNQFAAGIPGALSNQPPAQPEAPEEAGEGSETQSNDATNFRRQATINYNPDHSVTHTKRSVGEVTRLSIAIVVDHKKTLDQNGQVITEARTQEELTRITEIAKGAIGFSLARGDSINVINELFYEPEPFKVLPEPPIWEQSWFMDVMKQSLAALLILYLVFGLLRPTMKKMVMPVKTKEMLALEAAEAQASKAAEGGAEGTSGEAGTEEEVDEMFKLEAPKTFDMQVKAAREIVKEDPKRVSQVVKKWLGSEADDG